MVKPTISAAGGRGTAEMDLKLPLSTGSRKCRISIGFPQVGHICDDGDDEDVLKTVKERARRVPEAPEGTRTDPGERKG